MAADNVHIPVCVSIPVVYLIPSVAALPGWNHSNQNLLQYKDKL